MANGQDQCSLHQEALQRLLNGSPKPDVAAARLTAYFDERSDAASDLIGSVLIRMLKEDKVSPEVFPACFTFAARLRRPALRHPLWQVAAGLAEDTFSPSAGSPGTDKIKELDELLRVYYDAGGEINVALDTLLQRQVIAGGKQVEAVLRLLRWTGAFGSDAPASDASAVDVHRWVRATLTSYCRKAVPACEWKGDHLGIAAALRTIGSDDTDDLIRAYRQARGCDQAVSLAHLRLYYGGTPSPAWGRNSRTRDDLALELFEGPPPEADERGPTGYAFENERIVMTGNPYAKAVMAKFVAHGRWSEAEAVMTVPRQLVYGGALSLALPAMFLAETEGRFPVAAALGQILLDDHRKKAADPHHLQGSWLMRAVRACCDASFKEEEGPLHAREAAAMARIPNFGDTFFVYDPARHDLTCMPPEIVREREAMNAKKARLAGEILAKILAKITELFDRVIAARVPLELDVL